MAGIGKILMIVAIIVIIIVGIVIYKYTSKQESFTPFATNSIDHIGGLEDPKREYYNTSSISNIGGGNNGYSMIPPEGNGYYNPIIQERYSNNEAQTIQRLDRIDNNLIPKTSLNVTPYDVDVADPQFYIYQVQPPRVLRKDPQAMQADPVRGDIPIRAYPDIPLIEKSQYGRDSLRLDGTFSEALRGLYNKYTGGAYLNYPQHTSLGATIAS